MSRMHSYSPSSWMLSKNGYTKDGHTVDPDNYVASAPCGPFSASKCKRLPSFQNHQHSYCHLATDVKPRIDLESSFDSALDPVATNLVVCTKGVIHGVPKIFTKSKPLLIAAIALLGLSTGMFALLAESNTQLSEPTSATTAGFAASTDAFDPSTLHEKQVTAENSSDPVAVDLLWADPPATIHRTWLGTLRKNASPALTQTRRRAMQWEDFPGLLINVGSDRIRIDSQGNRWVGDKVYRDIDAKGKVVGKKKKCKRAINDSAIDNNLFCTGRVKQPSFRLYGIPEGVYAVTVHFTYPSNKRNSFEVHINRLRVFKDLPSSEVEAFTALSISVEAVVNARGQLEIDFLGLHKAPQIHAIEIHKANSNKAGAAVNLSYLPGLLSREQHGLLLSEGLEVSLIATAKENVVYSNGMSSQDSFHEEPDAGSTFADTRPENQGGWIYVSNSEVRPSKGNRRPGGVGAITFDRNGKVIDYRRLLRNTRSNCGGGRTPWNTWISCEEVSTGRIYQVDPLGLRAPEKITMGEIFPGNYESFAYDSRDTANPHFFVTKDEEDGELRRFSPSPQAHNESRVDPWNLLTGNGTLEFLVLTPSSNDENSGTFRWSPRRREGSANAKLYYPNSEGIDVFGHQLFFVSKVMKRLVILDLDANTFVFRTTASGLMNGQPDQVHKLTGGGDSSMLYFTEDGGRYAGIHGRNSKGQFFTILESHVYADETTGLSFSPDFKHLYVAYQHNGLLFDIQRQDGLSFQATPLNIKYHNTRFSLST